MRDVEAEFVVVGATVEVGEIRVVSEPEREVGRRDATLHGDEGDQVVTIARSFSGESFGPRSLLPGFGNHTVASWVVDADGQDARCGPRGAVPGDRPVSIVVRFEAAAQDAFGPSVVDLVAERVAQTRNVGRVEQDDVLRVAKPGAALTIP